MSAPFNEVEMMILSQLSYKDPPAGKYSNGNPQVSLYEYLNTYYSYLEESLGEDSKDSLDNLLKKVSGNNERKYRIVKSHNDKYETGFSAFAVRGPDEDTVTVAARGTEFGKLKEDPGSALKDVATDLSLGFSSETDQQNAMNKFMEEMGDYQSIYLTGHSLGGNLVVSGAIGYGNSNKIKGVYTYNAPGQNAAYIYMHKNEIAAVENKIVNYQNEGDMVSDINFTIGKKVIVKTETRDSVDFYKFKFVNHMLDDMTVSDGTLTRTETKKDSHYLGGFVVDTLTTGFSFVALMCGIAGNFDSDEAKTIINDVGKWCKEKARAAEDFFGDKAEAVGKWFRKKAYDVEEWTETTYEKITGKGSDSKIMAKKESAVICDGHIDTEKIYAAHSQIKEIVESYKDVNLEVSQITKKIKENWVGEGRNEFESQYNLLIKKIDDFGDTLQEIYDALVEAEAGYEKSDDNLRKDFVKAIES